jgi:uncharacterized MAPEG superfamily protein
MQYVPYAAIAVAFALIYVPRSVVGREMKRLAGGYDNRDPRTQQAQLAGLGRRALGAHHNGFEAFAPFAAAVLMAAQRGVNRDVAAGLCIGFIVARMAYVWAYLADKPAVRSGLWGLGFATTGALMVLAVRG